MKIEFDKRLPIIITIAIAIILNIFFIVLSYVTNTYVFPILIQVSYALLFLLVGIDFYFYKKQRVIGGYMWFASGIFLFMMYYVLKK